jgi:hypothetical protein
VRQSIKISFTTARGFHAFYRAALPLSSRLSWPTRATRAPESQKQANAAHAKLRSPGERANAQLKTWCILRKLRCCPWRARQFAKAIHVLQAREANAG